MKILLINKFLYPKGGDALSTLQTGALLKETGHEVEFWGMSHPENPQYPLSDYFVPHVDYNRPLSFRQKLKASANIIYSFEAKKKLAQALEYFTPDIVHLNNFAHQISPSILDLLKSRCIPAVMTMHDFKMACPTHKLLLNGKPCGKCRNGRYYYCLLKKCTKNSISGSLVNTAEMYLHHKMWRIYDAVSVFISPSLFMMNKLKEMGFLKPVIHLPNFVIPAKSGASESEGKEKSILYAGRLSEEKGLFVLLDAVKHINATLKIIGGGPLRTHLENKIAEEKIVNAKLCGYMKQEDVFEELKKSLFVVLPSICYENNPGIILEAFSRGIPAIGSRSGGIPELVIHGETGLTFSPGNADDLKTKIIHLLSHPQKIREMGEHAYSLVLKSFGRDRCYNKLINIYGQVIKDYKNMRNLR
jgi:glycosyltransferase involved in cell wall biosynthesis